MRVIAVTSLIFAMLATSAASAAEIVNKPEEEKPQTGRWAVIETNKGTIKFALYEQDAPITTQNFIELAEKKFYDGLKWHHVVPDFVIQGGDPNGDSTGGSEKTIKLEVSPKLKHDAPGVVAMARRLEPDSTSSQFYITLDKLPFLDMKYAVFGRVTEGMDVVKKIEAGDVMKTVRIIPDPTKPAEEKKPADDQKKTESKEEKK